MFLFYADLRVLWLHCENFLSEPDLPSSLCTPSCLCLQYWEGPTLQARWATEVFYEEDGHFSEHDSGLIRVHILYRCIACTTKQAGMIGYMNCVLFFTHIYWTLLKSWTFKCRPIIVLHCPRCSSESTCRSSINTRKKAETVLQPALDH